LSDWAVNNLAGFDAGTKSNLITATDQYIIAIDRLGISMPYAAKHANLLSYYRLENNGTDQTGNNNGTPTGSPSYASAKFDNGMTIASGKYLSCGTYFSKPVNFTIALWIKPTAWTNASPAVSCAADGSDTNLWGIIGRDTGDNIECYVSNGSVSQAKIIASHWNSTNYPNNVFTFIVMTVDGSYIRFYRNGVEVGTGTVQTVQNGLGVVKEFCVGRLGAYNGYYFTGLEDEVKIYNTALSDAQISALYNSGNRYKTSGNWTSATQAMTAGCKMSNLKITLANTDANNYIDKIEVLDASDDSVITTAAGNITATGQTTLVAGDFDNGLDGTLDTDFKVKVYMVAQAAAAAQPYVSAIEGDYISAVKPYVKFDGEQYSTGGHLKFDGTVFSV